MSTLLHLPSLTYRVLHQLRVDARRDRGLLLMWLLLLAVHALEHLDREALHMRGAFMPEALPMAVGLLLAWRVVKADDPGSADSSTLTRPLGRGALWLAKFIGIALFGLLPWLLVKVLVFRGYGLGMISWLGVAIAVLLPAAVGVFAACWLACLRMKSSWTISLAALACLYLLLPQISRAAPNFSYLHLDGLQSFSLKGPNADLHRCQVIVGMSGTALVLLWAWWRATLGRVRSWMVLIMLALIGVLASFWPWNWRALSAQAFSRELQLHIGPAPEKEHQSLWSTLHLSGLAQDEVAAIMAFAPILPDGKKWPPEPVYTDFFYWDEKGQKQSFWRWMNVDHAQRLSGLFPAQTSWVGEEDKTRDPLSKVLAKAEKRHPGATQSRWRLRLAVHRLRKVQEKPLAEVLRSGFTAAPMPGWQFDLVKNTMSESSLNLETRLYERWPLTVPNLPWRRLNVLGRQPVTNLLLTAHAPGIDQVVCLHEPSNDWYYFQHSFWHHEHARPCEFFYHCRSFIKPSPASKFPTGCKAPA
ncbi:MAG: hypothetical protein IPK32_03410 [Verrucomicrobiaceae bacterium]|nr:hypothetical protein [Verrucomicrobiaceae bacterium]